MLIGFAQTAYHIRRCARSGYAHQNILIADLEFRQVFPRLVEIILGKFNRFTDSIIAARHDAYHLVERYAERRRAFRSILDAEPAAGARAYIEKTPPGFHFFGRNSG